MKLANLNPVLMIQSLRYKIIALVAGILFCHVFVTTSFAQETQLSGQVTNEKKESIPGVSIFQKGTTQGTLSDAEGKFAIHVTLPAVIVFSAIGYEAQEILVETQKNLTIELKEDITSLDEVVVVGYGEQKRSNL